MTELSQQIAALLKRIYTKSIEITSLETITKSYNTNSYLIKTSCGDYLLKLALRNNNSDQFLNLVATTRILSEIGIKVPQIIYFNKDQQINGRPFLLQEWLPGIDAEEALSNIDSLRKEKAIINLGKATAQIHSVTNSNLFGVVEGTDQFVTWEKYLLFNLEKRKAQNQKKGILSEAILNKVSDFLIPRFEKLYDGRPCLTHLDLHLPNILLLESEEIGLIDFEHSKFGDPLRDFVKLRLTMFTLDERYEQWFLEGYCQYLPWPKDAEKRIQVYMVLEYLAAIPYFAEDEPELVAGFIRNLNQLSK